MQFHRTTEHLFRQTFKMTLKKREPFMPASGKTNLKPLRKKDVRLAESLQRAYNEQQIRLPAFGYESKESPFSTFMMEQREQLGLELPRKRESPLPSDLPKTVVAPPPYLPNTKKGDQLGEWGLHLGRGKKTERPNSTKGSRRSVFIKSRGTN